MKLIRFGKFRSEKPGVRLESGDCKDLSGHFADWNADFFNRDGLARLSQVLTEKGETLPDIPTGDRIGSPVARPGKVICIGLNYADHAAESGMDVPSEPIIFMKTTNTVVGPYDSILIPRKSEKTDWEVELGVIVGRESRYLENESDAENHIAGYCISNDVSERAFQLEHGGQWTKGKSCDNFNPLGPWLVTSDEVRTPQHLAMTLDVNGERKQDGNTSTMVFKPAYLIWYLSQFMTLEAGDLISTGTPPGVGMGKKPQRFLRAGDIVELSIAGLGQQRQKCVNA